MSLEPVPLDAPLVIADDDADDRYMILRAIRRAGATIPVASVSDGIELMNHLRARSPASLPGLVLLDLNMPRMDGREVLRAMRSDAALSAVSVVVMTTSVEPQDRSGIQSMGATGFVSKPERFSLLVEVLRDILSTSLPLALAGARP